MALNFESTGLKPIGDIEVPDIYYNRYMSGIEEFDYLLGNGALPGSVITICARGGLGKSTLLLQVLEQYDEVGLNVAYLSGEESVEQIAFKSGNLGVHDVPVANITDLDEICELMEELDILVIDSFQHMTTKRELGERKLQRVAIDQIVKRAQETHCTVFIIMHVTKAGILKGDSYVPHTADVNMEIRSGEEEYGDRMYRIIDIPTKNRFGPPTEIVTKIDANGYTFTIDTPEKKDVAKVSKRSKAKQSEFDKILLMIEPAAITPERVMEELDVDYAHAYGRLAELTKNGKLVKYGRGQNAVFQVANPEPTYKKEE